MSPHVELIELDLHINDPEFAERPRKPCCG